LGTRGLCVVSTYSAQIARIPTPDGMTAVNTGIRCHETLAVASPSSLMSACTHLRELAVSALMHWSSGYVLLRGRINWTINRPGLLSICKHGGSSTRASTPGLQRRRSERMSDQPVGVSVSSSSSASRGGALASSLWEYIQAAQERPIAFLERTVGLCRESFMRAELANNREQANTPS
jgi:hypothetical protein